MLHLPTGIKRHSYLILELHQHKIVKRFFLRGNRRASKAQKCYQKCTTSFEKQRFGMAVLYDLTGCMSNNEIGIK